MDICLVSELVSCIDQYFPNFPTDCKSMCHPECKDSLPLPCINAPPTPGTGKIQGVSDNLRFLYMNHV